MTTYFFILTNVMLDNPAGICYDMKRKYCERSKAVQSQIQRVSGWCEGTKVRGELRLGVAALKCPHRGHE